MVNLITWSKAYSIFPLTTFIQHKGYMLKTIWDDEDNDQDNQYSGCMQKYEQRGWTTKRTLNMGDQMASNHPIRNYRQVADRYTWVVPLDTSTLDISTIFTSKVPQFVLDKSSFSVRPKEYGATFPNSGLASIMVREPKTKFYEINTEELKSKALQYTYLVGDEKMFWYIGHRADGATRKEILKIKGELPLTDLRGLLGDLGIPFKCGRDHLDSFRVPSSWSFHDDEFPFWCQAWMQKKATEGGLGGLDFDSDEE